MTADIPQPASERYEVGDLVSVYVDEDDPDSRWHGVECRVVEVLTDDLADETERELDGILYRVEVVASGERVPVDFRHRDLVPSESGDDF